MIYFTADLHLGHGNIIKHCNRPFSNAYEMDKALIKNWNDTVKADDEVYILGDFTFNNQDRAHGYVQQLSGRKYLIKGNHDKFLKGGYRYKSDFVWIQDYYELRVDNQLVVLMHYPIAEWNGWFRGSIHLYGHVHNSATSNEWIKFIRGPAFNVGVDLHDFKPVSLEKVFEMASKLKSNIK